MQIFVFGIGMSSRQNLSKGESEFKSSLIHDHNSKHTLFVLTIDNDLNCLLEIYQEFQLIKCIKERTSDEFSEREFNAWKTLIRAVGGFNITPWPSDESEIWTYANSANNDKEIL
ncbi:21920_t:CDS:2 [Cetraspora pellucida]|uniref:21920_t:CDS:1 n=1 Tax=Cetraspora pellucida TaxID=1433469 RepID=A0A9N9EV11_9GLOM|nr:21920_t:CDS:2 [Cetraspora pellucida]